VLCTCILVQTTTMVANRTAATRELYIHFSGGALRCCSFKSVDGKRTYTNQRTPRYRSGGIVLLYFPLPVVGLSIYDRPPCTSDIFHPILIYTIMRIDVKANTTIAVRRLESNDIPGGNLGKMIDGTWGSHSVVICICIYITTIVRVPDVINNDFACLQSNGCFLFFRLMDVKSTNLRKRRAGTFRNIQYTLHRIVEIVIHLSFVVSTQHVKNTVRSE